VGCGSRLIPTTVPRPAKFFAARVQSWRTQTWPLTPWRLGHIVEAAAIDMNSTKRTLARRRGEVNEGLIGTAIPHPSRARLIATRGHAEEATCIPASTRRAREGSAPPSRVTRNRTRSDLAIRGSHRRDGTTPTPSLVSPGAHPSRSEGQTRPSVEIRRGRRGARGRTVSRRGRHPSTTCGVATVTTARQDPRAVKRAVTSHHCTRIRARSLDELLCQQWRTRSSSPTSGRQASS